jgi:hypothetical protein
MGRMKSEAVLLVTSIPILFSGGCGTTPASRLAQAQSVLAVAQTRVGDLQTLVAQFEAAGAQAKSLLADPNLPPEMRTQVLAAGTKIEEELARYQPQLATLQTRIAKLEELIAQAQASGSEIGLGQELEVYGQGLLIGSGTLPSPVNAYTALAGVLATVIGGAIGSVTRGRQAQVQLQEETAQVQQQNDTVIQGIVGSVNALIESDAVPDPAAAKKILQDYQVENCPEARVAVRKAQGLAA